MTESRLVRIDPRLQVKASRGILDPWPLSFLTAVLGSEHSDDRFPERGGMGGLGQECNVVRGKPVEKDRGDRKTRVQGLRLPNALLTVGLG